MKLPKYNSDKFRVLQFIGAHTGVRAKDVARFIVEILQRKTYDPKRGCGAWNITLYHQGSVNPIYPTYCTRVGQLWYLNKEAADLLRTYYVSENVSCTVYDSTHAQLAAQRSSLEADLPSDEIKDNSRVISVERITLKPLPVDAPKFSIPEHALPPAGAKMATTTGNKILDAVNALEEARAMRARARKNLEDAEAYLGRIENEVRKLLGL